MRKFPILDKNKSIQRIYSSNPCIVQTERSSKQHFSYRKLQKEVEKLKSVVDLLETEVKEIFEFIKYQSNLMDHLQNLNHNLRRVNEQLDHDTNILIMNLQQRDDTLAVFHRKLFMRDEIIEELWQERSSEVKQEVKCSCCFSNIEHSAFVQCNSDQKHAVCLVCVDGFCQATIENPCYELRSSISCCFVGDCDGRITDIGCVPAGRQMIGDFYLHESLPHIMSVIRDESNTAQDVEQKLHFLKMNGTFRGLQCSQCQYGPMWNENCSELITHHNQSIDETYKINNSCPKCNLLVHDVRYMVPWNGCIIHTELAGENNSQ